MKTTRTIVGEIIGSRGRHRVIVKEDRTGRLYELDRFAIVRPVDQNRGLSEFEVTERDE